MERRDNYKIQADQAKRHFLRYDQEKLIRKLKTKADEAYIYVAFLCQPYRIHRTTGHIQRQAEGLWIDGDSFGEVMTLLDLVCDSREDRYISGRWKNMLSFGLMFHQNLLEDAKDPYAEAFDKDPESLRRACLALKGEAFPQGDVAYAIELFEGLKVVVQLWQSDEEFPPSLRFLWDENALMYLKYETMHFAKGLLLQRLLENT